MYIRVAVMSDQRSCLYAWPG